MPPPRCTSLGHFPSPTSCSPAGMWSPFGQAGCSVALSFRVRVVLKGDHLRLWLDRKARDLRERSLSCISWERNWGKETRSDLTGECVTVYTMEEMGMDSLHEQRCVDAGSPAPFSWLYNWFLWWPEIIRGKKKSLLLPASGPHTVILFLFLIFIPLSAPLFLARADHSFGGKSLDSRSLMFDSFLGQNWGWFC